MNIRKNLVLIVSGGVFLIAAIAVIVLLAGLIGRFHRVSSNLADEKGKFDGLVRQKVFPNRENVDQMRQNVDLADASFTKIITSMARDRYEAPPLEPAQFPILLNETISRLRLLAISNNCMTVEPFYFGFDRYAKALPVREDIPRLARQLHFSARISSLLFELRVSRLLSIERQLFEQGAAADGGMMAPIGMPDMGGAPAASTRDSDLDPSGLFRKEKYVVSFMAREDRIWEVLETLARSPTFLTVSQVEFTNLNPVPMLGSRDGTIPADMGGMGGAGFPAPMGGAPMPGPGIAPMAMDPALMGPAPMPAGLPPDMGISTNQIPPHDMRVMAGRNELVTIKLDVWAYNFIVPAAPVAAADTNAVPAAAAPGTAPAPDAAPATNDAPTAPDSAVPAPAAPAVPAPAAVAAPAKESQP